MWKPGDTHPPKDHLGFNQTDCSVKVLAREAGNPRNFFVARYFYSVREWWGWGMDQTPVTGKVPFELEWFWYPATDTESSNVQQAQVGHPQT